MVHALVIVARFYEDIGANLVAGACKELDVKGVSYEVVDVPGAFEIPSAIRFAINTNRYDAYVVLGCVIRGETGHYDVVCQAVTEGVGRLSIKHQLALGFGVITAENKDQADNRADPARRNYGGKAAKACLAMLDLKKRWVA